MAYATATPRGHAATAAEFLDLSAEGADTLAALQGIGYALLAVVDQLADVADTGTDCAGGLDEIAGYVADLRVEPLGARTLGALRYLASRARPGHAREADVGPPLAASLVRGVPGPGKNVVVRPVAASADGAGAAEGGKVIPLDTVRRPLDGVVLDAVDTDVVHQALADAAAWRAWKAEGADCADCTRLDPGRCAVHAADDGLAVAYETLLDRIAGGAS